MKKMCLIVLIICLISLTGCVKDDETSVISDGKKVNTDKMQHKHCTRTASAKDDIEVSLNYDIYYTGDILNIVQSEEKVTSSKKENLDEYEKSYKKITTYYENLQYYDMVVNRDEKTVSIKTTINYDKVDIGKLLDIEGEEDNVIENGKAKLDKWLELAKKFGAKCTEVTDEV